MNGTANNRMHLRIVADATAVADAAVSIWHECAIQAVTEHGAFSVALSGGTTPIPFFDRLAGTGNALPWRRTHVFLADERFVPLDDRRSNAHLIAEHLVDGGPLPQGQLHTMSAYAANVSEAAEDYESCVQDFFGITSPALPVFDLIVLGVGEDGHTASLFPGTELDAGTSCVVIPVESPASPPQRISLALPVLNNAAHIIFLVTGTAKARVMRSILADNTRALPAALVQPTTGTVSYLLDEEAASHLPPRAR